MIPDLLLCHCVLVGIVMKLGSQVEMPLHINVVTTQKDLWPKTSRSTALCTPVPALFVFFSLMCIYFPPTWLGFKTMTVPRPQDDDMVLYLCALHTRKNDFRM